MIKQLRSITIAVAAAALLGLSFTSCVSIPGPFKDD